MDDLYGHPFFRMDDDHSHKGPRSSGVMVARPMSISSPGEIIKLDLGAGKKTPSLQTSPIMKRFRGETDDMLEWHYRSEEELASPCTKEDDLSSRPSFSTIDDDYDDQLSLVDDGDVVADVDEDELEFLADFGLASSASDSILPAEQTQSQTCEKCTHAEAVKIIRPGQAKVVVLSKPPGSPHATVIRRSSFTSSTPGSPLASASNEPRMASSKRSSIVITSSLDRNASISSGKATSMASSNGHSTTSASSSEGNSSGNESLASSQPSSTTTTTGTSIDESIKTVSSLSPTPPRRRRRPSLPFIQVKPEAPHVWTMGLPTPQSAKKVSNDAPSSKRNSLVSPLSFSFPISSSTDASAKKATNNNTSGNGSKAKGSNPISLRSMWSAARPLRRKNNLASGSNANTNTPAKVETTTGQNTAGTDSSLSISINRRSGQFQAPPSSPNTSSSQNLISSANANSTAAASPRLIPRPANARAPPPVLPPFPRTSRLSFAERVEDQLDVSDCHDANLRYSAIDPLEHCDADDLAELAELADLMHPGFGFLQQDGACQSSSSSAVGLAAAAALVTGDSGQESTVDARAHDEAQVGGALSASAEMLTGNGAGLFTPGTPTFDADALLPQTSRAVEAST